MTITADIFAAYLKCPTRCFLKAHGETGTANVYADWVRTENEVYRSAGIARRKKEVTSDECVTGWANTMDLKTAMWRFAVDVVTQTRNLESRIHAIERIPSEDCGKAVQIMPVRFVFGNKLNKDDKLLLVFDALVLSEMLGRTVSIGKIIHGDDHSTCKVKIPSLRNQALKLTEKIAALLSTDTAPDLVLNRHCGECEYQTVCRQKAVEKDDLSLLSRMSAKERIKLRSKGIFTVMQLSYTFRVRRRCKRWRSQQPEYSHALRALAVREKKVHVIGRPKIELLGTPVYLDVEGTDDDFFYLLGCRTDARYRSFWAGGKSDERTVFEGFLEFLAGIPNPRLVFYGHYERRFFSKMRQRYAELFERFPSTENTLRESINLISTIYATIYFPTYGNTLKELAKYLGFVWTSVGASGLQALTWRAEWERTKEDDFMRTLFRYNAEDCEALELVTRFVTTLCQENGTSAVAPDCVRVEDLKPTGHFLINKGDGALPEFKAINQAAYWDYQRLRVYVRTNKVIKKASRTGGVPVTSHSVRGHFAHPPPTRCPICDARELLPHAGRGNSLVHDIKFLRHGAKAWVTSHSFERRYCPRCQHYVGPPLDHPFSLHKYGPMLRALAVDQLIRLNIPGATVARSLGDLFHYDLTGEHLSGFRADFAELYGDTVTELTARITRGSLVHADETAARVVGKSAVVWVLASMEEVVFLYAESREGEMVHEVLNGFRGVLVSDFYAVYDAFDCPQQKCLIHLIRDLNDDLHRYPFDPELRHIASSFTGVLKPIVETIDRRGLKARFLAKYQPPVRQFLTWVASQEFESETARKYAQRFRKNREKLFTFMSYDGVPWNNNNAENAIRAFAALRERIGGLCTEKSLRDYLILLSVSETCKRRGLNLFDFLSSGEKSLERFAAHPTSRRKARQRGRDKTVGRAKEHEDAGDDQRNQRTGRVTSRYEAMPVKGVDGPSPWDRFRPTGTAAIMLDPKRSLRLERFDHVPFGRAVLAVPALVESGLLERASELFPEWIDRPFTEIALLLISSMVLSQPGNVEALKHAWPADWGAVLCKTRLPDACSLVDLMNLIGLNLVGVAKWKTALADKWMSDASRVKAVLVVRGQQRIVLEAPAISSGNDRAGNSLFAHGMVEFWFRVLDGAPMLLLTRMPFEGMQSVWRKYILPQIESVLFDQLRKPGSSTARESPRLTVVFGEGGVDLRFFRKLQKDGLHIFSYRLSTDGFWPGGKFTEREVEVQPGRHEFVRTAEHEVSTADGLPLREMLCVRRNGPQLTIISSDRELNLLHIGARMAFEFTASRFLDRLQRSMAVVRSFSAQQNGAAGSKVGTGLESFLGTTVLVVSRAEAIMEQILREALPRPMGSPLALRQIVSEPVDLVPVPGASILKVFVHVRSDAAEQTVVAHLCSRLTATETRFPGTNMRLVYEPVS